MQVGDERPRRARRPRPRPARGARRAGCGPGSACPRPAGARPPGRASGRSAAAAGELDAQRRVADQTQAHPGRSVPSGRCARHYEDFWADAPADPEPWAWERRRALLLAEARPGERVLDLGCGAGRFVAALRDAGADPVGVEIAEAALERARRNVPGADLRLRRAGRLAAARPRARRPRVVLGGARARRPTRAPAARGRGGCCGRGGRLLVTVPFHGRVKAALIALAALRARTSTRSAQHLRFYTRRRWRARSARRASSARAAVGRPPLLRAGLTAQGAAPEAPARLASRTSDVDAGDCGSR